MDGISLEVMYGKLSSISEEMQLIILKSAHSRMVNEACDATSALLNLGYVQGQINSAINEAIPQEKEMKLEKLIKNCIKILSS